MALGARDSPGAREVSAHDATLTDEVQKLVYWINSLPGKRCLLASKPKHLRDGECICELTAMLLGAAAAGGRPPSKTSPLKKQSDVDRLERALDRLCTDAGLRLSGVGAGDARSRVLLTISKTAARIARGDPETTLHVLNFLRTALKHEAAIADPSLPVSVAEALGTYQAIPGKETFGVVNDSDRIVLMIDEADISLGQLVTERAKQQAEGPLEALLRPALVEVVQEARCLPRR